MCTQNMQDLERMIKLLILIAYLPAFPLLVKGPVMVRWYDGTFYYSCNWFGMTLDSWMMMERYPNLKEEVGGPIPGCEISSLHDRELASGPLSLVLWRWPVRSQEGFLVSNHLRPRFLLELS